MLKRKIAGELKIWKEQNERKCLIVEGARQIGKTYSIRQFGRENYGSFIEINFIENPILKNIFNGSLSADNILMNIRLYMPSCKIIFKDTLLFIDEIQECEEAIAALKFLACDDRISVICSGSALGMLYNPKKSYPVGSISYLDMCSLDFIEFLWAMGIDEIIVDEMKSYLENKNFDKKVPIAMHERFENILKQYLVIGGMPEVVQTFVDTNDYLKADVVQRRLYRDYLNDIARYAKPDEKIKAEKCYKTIPLQLSKENHKFQYGMVEKKGTSHKFESSVDWLINAHMVIPTHNLSAISYPLKAFSIENNFRLYPNDIGMLVCTYGYETKAAILEDKDFNSRSTKLILGTAKGGIYEALAADMLYKAGYSELYFYRSETGTPEIEFIVEGKDTLIPIEVKAGRSGTKSLNSILHDEHILYGYKFAMQNIGKVGKKITLPLYMIPFLKSM